MTVTGTGVVMPVLTRNWYDRAFDALASLKQTAYTIRSPTGRGKDVVIPKWFAMTTIMFLLSVLIIWAGKKFKIQPLQIGLALLISLAVAVALITMIGG